MRRGVIYAHSCDLGYIECKIFIKKGDDAQSDQRMRRGAIYAHSCDLGKIGRKYA